MWTIPSEICAFPTCKKWSWSRYIGWFGEDAGSIECVSLTVGAWKKTPTAHMRPNRHVETPWLTSKTRHRSSTWTPTHALPLLRFRLSAQFSALMVFNSSYKSLPSGFVSYWQTVSHPPLDESAIRISLFHFLISSSPSLHSSFV